MHDHDSFSFEQTAQVHDPHGGNDFIGFLEHAAEHLPPLVEAFVSEVIHTFGDLAGLHPHGFSAPGVPHVHGTPSMDAHYWHEQKHNNTCAIVSQQSIIEELTGKRLTEDGLLQEASNHGWYIPGPNGGTPLVHTGDLLEAYGLHVDRHHGASLKQLTYELDQHHKVIVGLNGEMIWNELRSRAEGLGTFIGIPEQHANHAVEVIGIDYTDPHHPMVLLNDSGTAHGCGERVPLDLFERSWATSQNFMVSASSPQQHRSALFDAFTHALPRFSLSRLVGVG
jgi:hypothetical protein